MFRQLDRLVGGNLHLLFSGDYVPERVTAKAKEVLGDCAHALTGEWKLGREDQHFMANRNISFRYQPGIRKRIRELQPDVMVCDGFFKWTLPCLMERIRRKTPLVVCYERTAHTERNVQWFRTRYRRWAVKHIDVMCCSGRLCGEYTQSLGMPADCITYGHMVADTEGLAEQVAKHKNMRGPGSLDAPAGSGAAPRLSSPVFLYVGRLISLKGLRELFTAWSKLADTRQGSLLLVGDGPQREELETFCREQRLANVCFAGAVDHDEIAQCYAMADAFIMPTLEDNWSLVVPEAMACGLPILCSKYNGCWPELVQEGKNGWVFDPLDTDNTVAVLRNALAHADDLPKLGEASREIIADHTPKHAAQAVFDACHIAGKRKP